MATDDLIQLINSPEAGFTPKREALYSIEHAAYGAPKSPVAVAYQEERQVKQRWAQWVAVILGGIGAVVGGSTLGVLVLRRVIAKRIRRIRGLLGPYAEPQGRS